MNSDEGAPPGTTKSVRDQVWSINGNGTPEVSSNHLPTPPSRLRGGALRSTREKLRYEHLDLVALSTAEFEDRFSRMGEVALDATLGAGDSAWIETDWAFRRARVRELSRAYMVWNGSELAGFTLYSTFPFHGRTAIHMQSGYVRTAYQRGGIGYSISARVAHRAFLTGPWREFLLVSDMLNPVVLAGWLQRFPDRMKMFPPEFGVESDELRHLAQEIAERLYPWAEYDPETSVLRGRTTPRSAAVPESGDSLVDRTFSDRVDPVRGDTLLVLGEFDRMTVLRGLRQLVRTTGRMLDRRLRDGVGRRSGPDPTDTPA